MRAGDTPRPAAVDFAQPAMDPTDLLRAFGFAAHKHSHQRRKDRAASPYVNHVIAVAQVLAVEGGVTDMSLLVAAVLHDTVEDTKTTFEELEETFGRTVADLVRELTDDKSLDKAERKRLQIVHAASASDAAKQLKIADKIGNLRDIVARPPVGWPRQRKVKYLVWAAQVVDGCRGVNRRLDTAFDRALAAARDHLAVPARRPRRRKVGRGVR